MQVVIRSLGADAGTGETSALVRRGLGLWTALCMWLAGQSGGMPASAAPVISEFMAANETGLQDEDRQVADWIEVANPDAVPFDLAGCFLTDSATRLNRWMFPAVTIPARGFLVVFASGKNRRNPGAPLHTDFKLDAGGEFLALVAPDGRTVLSQFAPLYPKQYADTSYGTPSSSGSRDLLAGATLKVKVPTLFQPLETDWQQAGFVAQAGWVPGVGFAVGFDAGFSASGTTNLARRGVATQSSNLGGSFPAAFGNDGDPSTFTHTDGNDNQSTWSVDLGRDFEIARVVLRNRTSCCQSRLRDITVSLIGADGVSVLWKSPLFNAENVLGSPAEIEIDLFELNVGPVVARQVRVSRTPDPDLSGSGGQGNADEDNVLSLGEVEVYGANGAGFGELIRTDLTTAARGSSAAVAVRATFQLKAPLPTSPLRLQVRFDDGLVAWMNGQFLWSSNAPPDVGGGFGWVASRERADTNAVKFVTVEVHPSLLREGENVLALLGLNVAANDDDLLIDARLEADGPSAPPPAYFDRATPGAANDSTWYLGRLKEPDFSRRRGFQEAAFDLVLTADADDGDAMIVYTLDGSEPTAERGTPYTAPVRIDRTRVVRARAVRADHRPSSVASHTYLFAADVVRQPVAPAGFPNRWADVAADYEMDPAIAQSATYGGRMNAALRALPSVCFSTEVDNLFGASRGIYANPENRGVAWERPIAMEWIEPDGEGDFQTDAGLRIQGGYFRQRGVTQKHSLRVVFKDEYGPGRLSRDLFGEFGAAREFDTLVLRAGANDGYAWDAARDTEQFLRDEFGRRIGRAMGLTVSHGRFVHVYLNGLYWGVYNLVERPNEDFSSTYFGGAPEEWDSINSGEVKSGDLNAWNQFIAGVRVATNVVNYLKLQGLDAAGVRSSTLPVLFDESNYMNYMLLNIWGGNWDWPNKNFWFGRRRTAESTGFKFYLWDFENTMGNNRGRSPLNMVSPRSDIASSWVGEPHARLKSNAEYRLHFADQVQKHFFGEGPLAPAQLVPRYRSLAQGFATAIIAETARWGDDHHEPPQDASDWERERDWLLNNYLPQRTAVVLGQLKAAGLYPTLPAPEVVGPAGSLTSTTPVSLATPARHLVFTLDGTDPRLPGGAPHPAAQRVEFTSGTTGGGGTSSPQFLSAEARWRYWDRGTDPGASWNQPAFDDSAWPSGPAELGYGDGDEATLVGSIDADPAQSGVQRNAATYFRTTFIVDDPAAWTSFAVEARYDDAVAVYLNGQEVLRTANLPVGADFRTYATADAADNSVESRTGLPVSLLRKGTNWVAAQVHQRTASSTDISFAASFTGTPKSGSTGGGTNPNWNVSTPMAFLKPTRVMARSWTGAEWSPLLDVWLSPDTVLPSSANLVFSEIVFRPPDASTPTELAVTTDRDDFEFVELLNRGTTSVDMRGVRLAGGVQFEFGAGTLLPPGGRVLVVARLDAFLARYGEAWRRWVLGEFTGRLANEGEVLRLETSSGVVLHEVAYRPSAPWPTRDDGTGVGALQLVAERSAMQLGEPGSWRSSRLAYGTPGEGDTVRFNGAIDLDANGDGRPDFIDYALGAGGTGLTAVRGAVGTGIPFALVVGYDATAEDAVLALEMAPTASGPWIAAGDALELSEQVTETNGQTRRVYVPRNGGPTDGERYFRLVVSRR